MASNPLQVKLLISTVLKCILHCISVSLFLQLPLRHCRGVLSNLQITHATDRVGLEPSQLRHSPEWLETHCIQGQVTPGSQLSCQAPWAPSGFTQVLLGVSVLSAQNSEHQNPLHTVSEVKAMNERLLNLLHVNSDHWSPGPGRTLAGHSPLVSASHQAKSILMQLAAICSFLLHFCKSKIPYFSYNMLYIILPVCLSLS